MKRSKFRKNMIDYPHILQWFLVERIKSFARHWLIHVLVLHSDGAGMSMQLYVITFIFKSQARLKCDPGLKEFKQMCNSGI